MSAAARLLDAPPAGWDGLLATDPNATAAHRPPLWRALAAVLPGMTSGFLAVEAAGALLGGAPVMVERRAGLTWLHALPMLLPGAPLARPGAHAAVDRGVGEGLAALQRGRRAVGGEWAFYRPEGPAPDPAALGAASGTTRSMEARVVDLGEGIERAWQRVDRKTRQGIQRARERGLAFAEEPEAVAAVHALHLGQARGWSGHRALPLELSRRLLAGADDAGGGPPARLFTVRDRSGLLCGVLALDHPRETFLWWSGTHPAARGAQAYALLLWSVVAWAAAAGRGRVSLGASAGVDAVSAFKDSLGARSVAVPVRWLDARHAPAAGRLVAALQERVRRGRPRGAPA